LAPNDPTVTAWNQFLATTPTLTPSCIKFALFL